jgi:hypothetical protein
VAANSNQRNQQMAQLAAGIVADDKAIRDSLKGLVNDIINHQRIVMRVGSPQDKQALVKAVLPQMLAAMNTVAQDEAAAEEQAAYDRMRAALRGELPVHELPASLKAV